jgi:hypothetical protein
MEKIYEVHWLDGVHSRVKDFDDEVKARSHIELQSNGGHYATFVRGFDGRDRSIDLWSFHGEWKQHYIHGY